MTSVVKDITLATFMDSCERRTLQNMSGDPLLHCDMDDEEEVEMAVLTDIFIATSLERRTSSFIKFDAQELLQYVKGDDVHRLITRVLMSKRIKKWVRVTKEGNLKIRKKKILEVVEWLCFTSEEIVEYLTFYYFEEESSLNSSGVQVGILSTIPTGPGPRIFQWRDGIHPSGKVALDLESDVMSLKEAASHYFPTENDPCDDSVEAALDRANVVKALLRQAGIVPRGFAIPSRPRGDIGRGLLRPIVYLETPDGYCEETFLHHINAPYPDTKQ